MSKIPTAENLIDIKYKDFDELDLGNIWTNIENLMIEFAKLHVEAALKTASKNATASNKAKFKGDCNPQVDENSILNSYPLDKIK